jgi:Fur family transcriptional regulator, peroxide stress response regulator
MTIRLTKKRQQILSLLQAHSGALSAAEVHQQLPDIDLVTIYRNLDLFTKEKLIKRVHLSTDEAQYEYQTQPHHHAICTDCHKVIHFVAPDEKLKRLLGLEKFDVDEIEVTVRGTCKKKKELNACAFSPKR